MVVLHGIAREATARRAIAEKHARCRVRAHAVGERVYLWELLPPRPRILQWAP
jgi:hypothetical protein